MRPPSGANTARAINPTFPRPVFFGRMRFWKLSELERWEKAQAARTGKAKPEAA
jgi:hypothetical protein